MKKSFIPSIILALFFGVGIAWIDSRPTWDDAGVTVLMVLIAAFACGFIAVQKPWLFAVLVSIWIPMVGIIGSDTYSGLLVLVPGFIGAYTGSGFKQMIARS